MYTEGSELCCKVRMLIDKILIRRERQGLRSHHEWNHLSKILHFITCEAQHTNYKPSLPSILYYCRKPSSVILGMIFWSDATESATVHPALKNIRLCAGDIILNFMEPNLLQAVSQEPNTSLTITSS